MRYILTHLRRSRRRNRIPRGLLVSAAMMTALVLTLTLSASLFALPASAEVNIRMPRTEDGIVTDGDGIIDSDGIADDMPEVSDVLPGDMDSGSMNEGSDALDPAVSGTDEESETSTEPAATDNATTAEGTTDMVENAADNMGVSPWVIGLILLAIVIAIIILIIWWASSSRRRS